MNTILITGCSSGFGLETARLFLDRGWNVVATMRTPDAALFPASDRLRILPLDITDADSIRRVVAEAGPVDVLVNNAGIGLLGALEGQSMELVRHAFETNTFGTLALTQAMLPQMRERRSGTIVNVTSAVTLRALPLLAVYTASKAAVNAFTESLALELEPFGVQVKLVLPGSAPDTSFGTTARTKMEGAIPEAYGEFAQGVFGRMGARKLITRSIDVAEAVWRAATDPAAPARIPAGADAEAMAAEAAA